MSEPHINGLSTPQEKKNDPSPSKKDSKPRTHERAGLKSHEMKGRKEKAQPVKIRKSKEV